MDRDMDEELSVLPRRKSISIHTGNIVNWNRLKRRLHQTPTEELTECVNATLDKWLQSQAGPTDIQGTTDLECLDHVMEKLPQDERGGLKVTVKIFLSSLEIQSVNEAIVKVLNELGVDSIETVLLSVPEKHHDIEDIKPLWAVLESWVEQEKVFSLGISDINKNLLEALYDWAKVKPCLNQLNLASCCVIPQDLSEFAKEHDIQLLTHNDPKDILPMTSFQEVMVSQFGGRDGNDWEPLWVARYSVLIKCRGVIKTKGYVIKACKDLRKKQSSTG